MTSTAFDIRFAVIDVAGNGQQPPEIIEIAVVPVDGLTVAEPRRWLVKSSRPITQIVTRKVRGVRNADIANAPAFHEIAPDVLTALADRIPVAHNARVEYDVLRRYLPAWSPTVMIDTLRLARVAWPGLASYSLGPLLTHAGISATTGARHRAGFDAAATAQLLVRLTDSIGSPEQLEVAGALPGVENAESEQDALW